MKLGLIDGIGNADQVLKEKFGDKVVIKKFEKPKGFMARKLSSSDGQLTNTVNKFRRKIDVAKIWFIDANKNKKKNKNFIFSRSYHESAKILGQIWLCNFTTL